MIMPEEPYFVEVDENGCKLCGSGRSYTIIGPDTYTLSESWHDEETASKICEWLNEAYYHGKENAMPVKKKKAAKKNIKKVVKEEAEKRCSCS